MQPDRYAQHLEEILTSRGVTGASFAYWDGEELHTAVAGLRNSVTGDPVTFDSVMHIGSITKVLNTVLVLQLVDEGVIALEDPVHKHVPELRLRDSTALARITCAMLLNHTSGIDGDMLPDHGPDRERIEDAIARCAELGQVHGPGEATSYCNIGSVIAGYLVQKLRGTSWYTLIKKRIYEPLGMQHALAEPTDLPLFRHSIGDLTDPATGKRIQTTRPFLPLSFAPAGSTLMMTAADLVTFARALMNGGVGANGVRILSAALSERMSQPTAAFVLPACQVGLGWMILPGSVLTHGGTVSGGVARLCAHPSSRRVVALLTNTDRKEAVMDFLNPILDSWRGGSQQGASPAPDENAVIEPRLYEGVYESRLMRAEVSSRDAGLALHMSWKVRVLDNSPTKEQPRTMVLRALGDDAFEAKTLLPGLPDTQIRFVNPRPDGRMQFLATDGRLLVRTH